MKKILFLSFGFFFTLSTATLAADWKSIGDHYNDDTLEVYIDMNSIAKIQNKRRFYMKWVYEHHQTENINSEIISYDSIIFHTEMDCYEHLFRFRSNILYSGGESVKESGRVFMNWEDMPPTSIIRDAFDEVC